MENPPFEDVFPIQDGDFPLLCLFTGGYNYKSYHHILFFRKGRTKQLQNHQISQTITYFYPFPQDFLLFPLVSPFAEVLRIHFEKNTHHASHTVWRLVGNSTDNPLTISRPSSFPISIHNDLTFSKKVAGVPSKMAQTKR